MERKGERIVRREGREGKEEQLMNEWREREAEGEEVLYENC